MFKSISIIFLSILFLMTGNIMADDQLSAILDGIQKKYSRLPGLTVTYKREIITRSMAMLGDEMKGDLATGKMHFKPPHFLKVDQETPRPETVVTDGNTLWWYIPHKKQVHQYPSQRLGRELQLMGDIFKGLKEVKDSFDVTLTGRDENAYRLRLTPNPPWPQTDHINLSVAPDDNRIKMVEIHNMLGDITRFILGRFSVEKGFDDAFFRFVVPEGVKVIKGD